MKRPNGILPKTALLVSLLTSACAASQSRRAVPERPRTRIPLRPLCSQPALRAEQCKELKAFVRRQVAATVKVQARSSQSSKRGLHDSGTGVIISSDLVLTAYHVVKDNDSITVVTQRLSPDGKSVQSLQAIPMKILRISPDTEADVATLKPLNGEKLPVPMTAARGRLPRVGEWLWHFGVETGWAFGEVVDTNITAGDTPGLVDTDTINDFGDSGAPFVSRGGELVGILLSGDGDMKESRRTQFVPIDIALRALGLNPKNLLQRSAP